MTMVESLTQLAQNDDTFRNRVNFQLTDEVNDSNDVNPTRDPKDNFFSDATSKFSNLNRIVVMFQPDLNNNEIFVRNIRRRVDARSCMLVICGRFLGSSVFHQHNNSILLPTFSDAGRIIRDHSQTSDGESGYRCS